jgi:hypothetical protein
MGTFTPFALELYWRHLAGDTAEKLASELSIPLDRVGKRLQAAAAYLARHNWQFANASGAAHVGGERTA